MTKFIDPDGKEYIVEGPITKFSLAQGFPRTALNALKSGKTKNYKGWTLG